ncbi:hypothetical protein SISSUDRAFT_87574 [Sistotremastrum suecicum HHB10207 ss-3]|uniref:Mitochondrial adapter protein MCP1 transmembrane domain-containing protein n=1 Tax=Sistotremastrum suecicum HHB10207 ss-3 TaxID=1314776 RepID=A0A166BBN3_9AGAM|nr:hypothetical protein SISSUDRAFT_87574 [Sistotremastrum suecicum HHB10207 ss-3]
MSQSKPSLLATTKRTLLPVLSPPLVANVGGSEAASQVMLLGREYYQTSFGEPWLVFGPLAVHVAAGVLRRALLLTPTHHEASEDLERETRKPTTLIWSRLKRLSLLQITAYPPLIFLPIHTLVNRFYPMTPGPPIDSLGPGELDYAFVKVGFQGWSWGVRSWLVYGTLVGCTIIHASEGWGFLIRRIWGSRVEPMGKAAVVTTVTGTSRRRRRFIAGLCAI